MSRRRSYIDRPTLAKDTEILAITPETSVDKIRNAIDPPVNVLPSNPLPSWKKYPLEKKFPVVPSPDGEFTYARNAVGKKIYVSEPGQKFDNEDPYIQATPQGYEPLHDPHLTGFFARHPKMYEELVSQGLIDPEGGVNTEMKDFNRYRAYLGRLRNSKVAQELKNRDQIEKASHDQMKRIERTDKAQDKAIKDEAKKVMIENAKKEKDKRQMLLQLRGPKEEANMDYKQKENLLQAARREMLREKVRNRLAKLRKAERKRARRLILEWYCRQLYADMMRNARMQLKKDLRKEDLKSFIKSKREFQEAKSRYVNALNERKKAERECRVDKRKCMIDNIQEHRLEHLKKRAEEAEARARRELCLIRKYGMRWLNYVRSQKRNAETYHDSVWRVRQQLLEMARELKRESGKISFHNFIQGLFKLKPGRDPMPTMTDETREVMNYILDLLIQAAFDTYKETNHPCKSAYEKQANRRRILNIPDLKPEDFIEPQFGRREKPMLELKRPLFPCGHECVGVRDYKDDPCCSEEECDEDEMRAAGLVDEELQRLMGDKGVGKDGKDAIRGVLFGKDTVSGLLGKDKGGKKGGKGGMGGKGKDKWKKKKGDDDNDDGTSSGLAEVLVAKSLTNVTSAMDRDMKGGSPKPGGGKAGDGGKDGGKKGKGKGTEKPRGSDDSKGDDGGSSSGAAEALVAKSLTNVAKKGVGTQGKDGKARKSSGDSDGIAEKLANEAINKSKAGLIAECEGMSEDECKEEMAKRGGSKDSKDGGSGKPGGGKGKDEGPGSSKGRKSSGASSDGIAEKLTIDAINKSKARLVAECEGKSEEECKEEMTQTAGSSKDSKDGTVKPGSKDGSTGAEKGKDAGTGTKTGTGVSTAAGPSTPGTKDRAATTTGRLTGSSVEAETLVTDAINKSVGSLECKSEACTQVSVPGQDAGTQGGAPGQETGTQGGAPGREAGTQGGVPGKETGTQDRVTGQARGSQGGVPGQETGTQDKVPARETGIQGEGRGQEAGTQDRVPGQERGSQGGVPGQETGTQGGTPGQDVGTQGRGPGQDASTLGTVPAKDAGTVSDAGKDAQSQKGPGAGQDHATQESKGTRDDGTSGEPGRDVSTQDKKDAGKDTGVGKDQQDAGSSASGASPQSLKESQTGGEAATQAERVPGGIGKGAGGSKGDTSTATDGFSPRSVDEESGPSARDGAAGTSDEDSSAVAERIAGSALKKGAADVCELETATERAPKAGDDWEGSDAGSSAVAEGIVSKTLAAAGKDVCSQDGIDSDKQPGEDGARARVPGTKSEPSLSQKEPGKPAQGPPSRRQDSESDVLSDTSADALEVVKNAMKKAIQGLTCDGGDGGMDNLLKDLDRSGGPGDGGKDNVPKDLDGSGGPGGGKPRDLEDVASLSSSIIAQEAVDKALRYATKDLECKDEADKSRGFVVAAGDVVEGGGVLARGGGGGPTGGPVVTGIGDGDDACDTIIQEMSRAVVASVLPPGSVTSSFFHGLMRGRSVQRDVEFPLNQGGGGAGQQQTVRPMPSDIRQSVLQTLSNVQHQLDAIRHELRQYGVIRDPSTRSEQFRRDRRT